MLPDPAGHAAAAADVPAATPAAATAAAAERANEHHSLLADPMCAVCRERDAFGLLHEGPSEADPAWWWCVECLTAYLERDAVLAANPFLAHLFPPLPTPTWRPGRGQAKRVAFGGRQV